MTKRIPLSKWQFASLFLKQMGKCAKCQSKLEKGETIDEHLHPLGLSGTNDMDNRQLWCKACAKIKTFGTPASKKGSDITNMRSADRIARGGKRKSGKKIPSRPITEWRNFKGELVRK